MPKITALSEFAKKQGFRVGDELLKLGGFDMLDELDYLKYDGESRFDAVIVRAGKEILLRVKKSEFQSLGLEFDCDMSPRVCKNHCIFCFVDQLPKGLRSTLYIKDDDYRFSFISGSYVTLTNASDADIDRIIRLKLSPLYISVHAFDDEVRRYMLKNPNTLKLIDNMRKLGENGIAMHTQLVVVPDVNDGKILEQSIRGLKSVEGVKTVAVVPVGLTGHRNNLEDLAPVDEINAAETIATVEKLYDEYGGFCWCSDEYYVKAGLPVPDYGYYGAFDQIENGVGLLADFYDNLDYALSETEKVDLNKKIGFITGVSFAPILKEKIKPTAEKLGIECEVYGVINRFFGETVTVAGLVTAGDIAAQIKKGADAYVIPDNMLREFTDRFLDDVSVEELEKTLDAPVITVAHNGSDLPDRIVGFFKNKRKV